ncbi:unnamed protein product [Rhodiola kirilowii]
MEHEEDDYFALDGLKKGHPVRIRRASLLSLLSISATAQQRRLLRIQGHSQDARWCLGSLSIGKEFSTSLNKTDGKINYRQDS